MYLLFWFLTGNVSFAHGHTFGILIQQVSVSLLALYSLYPLLFCTVKVTDPKNFFPLSLSLLDISHLCHSNRTLVRSANYPFFLPGLSLCFLNKERERKKRMENPENVLLLQKSSTIQTHVPKTFYPLYILCNDDFLSLPFGSQIKNRQRCVCEGMFVWMRPKRMEFQRKIGGSKKGRKIWVEFCSKILLRRERESCVQHF